MRARPRTTSRAATSHVLSGVVIRPAGMSVLTLQRSTLTIPKTKLPQVDGRPDNSTIILLILF